MVRPIHMQDNLSKAPLAGREQQILQSSSDLAQRQLALTLNRQHLLDQSRARPTAASDAADNRVDDREERRGQGGSARARRDQGDDRPADAQETSEPDSDEHLIDLLA